MVHFSQYELFYMNSTASFYNIYPDITNEKTKGFEKN